MFQTMKKERGAVAILTVVIIAAATLLMAYSASLLGLGDLELGDASQKGGEAFYLADACAEESLRRFKIDANYAGGSLSLGGGSCIINVEDMGGGQKNIEITGTRGDYNKKINLAIAVVGKIVTINGWEEPSL